MICSDDQNEQSYQLCELHDTLMKIQFSSLSLFSMLSSIFRSFLKFFSVCFLIIFYNVQSVPKKHYRDLTLIFSAISWSIFTSSNLHILEINVFVLNLKFRNATVNYGPHEYEYEVSGWECNNV